MQCQMGKAKWKARLFALVPEHQRLYYFDSEEAMPVGAVELKRSIVRSVDESMFGRKCWCGGRVGAAGKFFFGCVCTGHVPTLVHASGLGRSLLGICAGAVPSFQLVTDGGSLFLEAKSQEDYDQWLNALTAITVDTTPTKGASEGRQLRSFRLRVEECQDLPTAFQGGYYARIVLDDTQVARTQTKYQSKTGCKAPPRRRMGRALGSAWTLALKREFVRGRRPPACSGEAAQVPPFRKISCFQSSPRPCRTSR